MNKKEIIRGIVKTGKIELEGQLANEGSLLYLENGILPVISDYATVDVKNGKGKVKVEIATIFSPGNLPFGVERSDKSFYQLQSLPIQQRMQIEKMFGGFESIFKTLLQDAWMMIGEIVSTNTANLPLCIIHFNQINAAMYCILDEVTAKAIKDQSKHLLN